MDSPLARLLTPRNKNALIFSEVNVGEDFWYGETNYQKTSYYTAVCLDFAEAEKNFSWNTQVSLKGPQR